MSREIKFRAWDKVEKECYYFPLGNKTLPKSISAYILEQYTGLKDKNGVEVYEGDIFELINRGKFTWSGKDPEPEFFIVDFRSGCFMADHEKNGKNMSHSEDVVIVWHELMESQMLIKRIGNIHEGVKDD